MCFFSCPMRNAAPPAEAEYSNALRGAPWLVSAPMASTVLHMPLCTSPMPVWMAAVPALQANS